MSWHQATGINAFCAAGANAGATRSASLTGFSAAIPRESVSSISLGLVRKETISRCFGRPFGIRVLGCRGLTSNTNGVAAPGASTNGWFSRRHNLRDCSERTNARQVGRKRWEEGEKEEGVSPPGGEWLGKCGRDGEDRRRGNPLRGALLRGAEGPQTV